MSSNAEFPNGISGKGGSADLENDDHPPLPPPLDTSPRAWLTVVGGFACSFTTFGWATSIGVFQAHYSTHQLRSYTPSTIAWIPSVETAMLFLGVCVFGSLFDALGPTLLLAIGTVLHVGGLLGLASATTYPQIFFTQSVISAAGTGAIFVAGTAAVGTWFRARRGLALGLVSSGSAVGAVVGTAGIPALTARVGFGWTIRAVALLYLALMLVAMAMTSRRPVVAANANANANTRSSKKTTSPPPPPPSFSSRVSRLLPVSLLRRATVFWLALASFFFNLGFFIPYDFVVVEARDAGDGLPSANHLLVILSATSIIGRIIPGWLSDRHGRFNTTIAFGLFTIVLVFAVWIGAPSRQGRIAFAALYGFGSGTFIAMVPALVAQICPDDVQQQQLGAYLGAVYIAIAPSVLINQPIAGALASAGGMGQGQGQGEGSSRNSSGGRDDDEYIWLKVFCGLAMSVGVCGFVVTRAAYLGDIGKPWKWAKV
ncbi:MFS general substrate transporter [Xylaria arbuscula]|nr:MFS general substrate transporter [Xylaria arbuscula]